MRAQRPVARLRGGDRLAAAASPGCWPTSRRYLTGPPSGSVFWTFNSDRGADLGSVWLVIAQATDGTVDVHTINVVSWLFFGAWCLGVLLLGLLAPATPRLAQLGFLVVAGFLLVNKVYSPQYVAVAAAAGGAGPAAVARPAGLAGRRGALLRRRVVVPRRLPRRRPGGDAGFYWVAILLRIAAELYLVGIVVRDVLRPQHDPVRDWVPAPRPSRTPSLSLPRRGQLTTTRSNAVAV